MDQSNKITHSDRSVPFRRVLGATSLTKDAVRNRNGDDLGSLKEVMIDIPAGRVAYAVLSFGGFLGIGNKLFAIPWEMLAVDEDRQCLLLDIDKKTLENAPGFDKDHWPDMSDPAMGHAGLYLLRPQALLELSFSTGLANIRGGFGSPRVWLNSIKSACRSFRRNTAGCSPLALRQLCSGKSFALNERALLDAHRRSRRPQLKGSRLSLSRSGNCLFSVRVKARVSSDPSLEHLKR